MKNRVRVLLIDDDEDDFVMIRDYLSEVPGGQYVLDWVPTFEHGMAELERAAHDVYLVDYRLGEKSGLQFLRQALERGCETPMILLTGFGDHEVDMEAMSVGAADFLVKSHLGPHLLERSIRYSVKRSRDLCERREMEAQLMRQERLASIGLLASGLAHEIGTPLGVIRGRAEYLAEIIGRAPGEKKSLQVIIEQIDRISTLIQSLLQLARGDDSHVQREVSIAESLGRVIDLMRHEFERSSIEVRVAVPQEAMVRANPERLQQVLLNLLVNALHAIQEAIGQGKAGPHRLNIEAGEREDDWELRIEDTGVGIPEKILCDIFKPFFTTKDIGKGTGLGLATSSSIVESWGGQLHAANGSAGGATFSLRIPRADRAEDGRSEGERAESEQADPSGSTGRMP